MTGSHRKLGLTLALALFAAPVFAAPIPFLQGGDVEELFKQGVDLLQRGRDEEALQAFQRVLAQNPTPEQAYELWKSTDDAVWLEMLVKRGDFELVAKRLMSLSESGRMARRNDEAAIKAALKDLTGDDAARRKAVRALASLHGEYAVPYMLPTLGEAGDAERSLLYITTLSQMDDDVVLPLVEALNSDDAKLRRNLCLALARIGDKRAAGMLAVLKDKDSDGVVRQAAAEALIACGGSGNALNDFLAAGDGYLVRRDDVLAPHQYSEVVWSWSEKGLVSNPVPRDIYGDELGRKSYYRALAVDPNSLHARAGLARVYATEAAKLEELAASGQDVSATMNDLKNAGVAVELAGADALDAGLQMAVRDRDALSGAALAHALGEQSSMATPGLEQALRSGEGALRSEAAIALARIALANRTPASADVVSRLGEATGREVVRLAFVIDAKADRCANLTEGLKKLGIEATCWDGGAKGLAMLHRVPGVDVVLVADSLPDLTTDQVIDDVRADPRHEKTPILVLSADAAKAGELYGSSTQGVLVDGGLLEPVTAALTGAMEGDRAKADKLAMQAAHTLAHLAMAGTNVSGALEGVASTLASRPDEVAIPAMLVLATAGDGANLAALIAVVGDAKRSDAARSAAAQAVARIVARGAQPSNEGLQTLGSVIKSDASLEVRTSAARAIGSLRMDPNMRADLLFTVRASPSRPAQ
jgi:CheY-like chemotaxis protein/tetratricopeptide (TPR) repeat protein